MHMPRLFRKEKGSIGLYWYKGKSFRWNLVQFIINFSIINNNGKFKEGDIVKYNWMAKVQLGERFLREKKAYNKLLIVTKILNKSESNVEYMHALDPQGIGSCACFWLRKAYWWEY